METPATILDPLRAEIADLRKRLAEAEKIIVGLNFRVVDGAGVRRALVEQRTTAETKLVDAEKRLTGLVEKLPRTKDGVTVTPKMRVWRLVSGPTVFGFTIHSISSGTVFDALNNAHCPDYLYSKESLAVAAVESLSAATGGAA